MATDNAQPDASGGVVEPANRAAVAKQVFQTPIDVPIGPRYELRDPFAEVTYRAADLDEMIAKADQLRATRFTAIEPDGSRVVVAKMDGEWQRPAEGPANRTEQTQHREQESAPADVAASANKPAAEATIAKVDLEAERAARVARLEAALFERYVIKRAPKVGEMSIGQTEYRYRGDTGRVAFTESTFRLSTDNNKPSVARSMVDVAEARNWQGLRVSGNEDFKRMVWLEASLRGVKTLGYEPQAADQELLRREREARAVNRIEPDRSGPRSSEAVGAPSSVNKASTRGGGRKAVLAALEAALVAHKVPQRQRDLVMDAAAKSLAQRLRDGQTLKVKVLDRAAPPQRVVPPPIQERQAARERSAPTR